MSRFHWMTLAFCSAFTAVAILLGHGAGYVGAIWAVWGLVMGYVAGSWMQAWHDARRAMEAEGR